MTRSLLVVDDDPEIRDILRMALGQAGFAVTEASDGAQALTRVASDRPDLVLLDVGLPEMDGFAVCREVRKSSDVPILFLTARDDEIDRVVGLEIGADDYVTKPFSPRELVARVRTILKRTAPEVAQQGRVLRRGVLEVDAERHMCRVLAEPVPLTGREMDLLTRLMARPDHVVSRPALVDAVYGVNIHVSDRTLDSHLRNLRSKLLAAGCTDVVETLHGVGIRMGSCRAA